MKFCVNTPEEHAKCGTSTQHTQQTGLLLMTVSTQLHIVTQNKKVMVKQKTLIIDMA